MIQEFKRNCNLPKISGVGDQAKDNLRNMIKGELRSLPDVEEFQLLAIIIIIE